MGAAVSDATILIKVDASDPGDPSEGLLDLLGPHEVVVLGYRQVPDQSTSGQLREQFGEQDTAAIEAIADRFVDQRGTVESTVVFTRNPSKTVGRKADEYDADAVLTTGDIGETLERVLVPLRGDETLDRIVAFVGQLLADSTTTVTLFNVPENEEEASTGEFLLRGARDRLIEDGIDPDRVDWRQKNAPSAKQGILSAADEYDLLVVGSSEPTLRERVLGDVTNDLVDGSPTPVLIVRN